MRTEGFYKAQGIGNQRAQSIQIIFDEEFPELQKLQFASQLHRQQGEKLANLLIKTLAGGTLDQLLVALLKAKASHFVIPHT